MSWKVSPAMTWNESVWNPSMLSTALWLDAADASTIAESGGAVSQWNDKSGNGRHATQSNSSYKPSLTANGLNGLNVVTFDGVNDILGFSDLAWTNNIGAISYFVVTKTSDQATTSYKALFQIRTGAGFGFDRASLYVRNSQLEAGGRRLDSNSYAFRSTGSLSSNAFQGSAIYNYAAATLAVNVNGGTVSSGSFQTVGNTSPTNSTASSIGSTNVGSDSFLPNSNQSYNGYVAEFVALASAASDTDRQKMEGYLAHKWGLTANLPAGHPYKLVGPTP